MSSELDIKVFHVATALLTSFANAVDRSDLDQLGSLFVPDATMDLPRLNGGHERDVLRGREAILARWRGERPFASRHIVGNVTAVSKGQDRIESDSIGIGIRGPQKGGAPFLIVVADYKDELEYNDELWRFRSRLVNSVFIWSAAPS